MTTGETRIPVEGILQPRRVMISRTEIFQAVLAQPVLHTAGQAAPTIAEIVPLPHIRDMTLEMPIPAVEEIAAIMPDPLAMITMIGRRLPMKIASTTIREIGKIDLQVEQWSETHLKVQALVNLQLYQQLYQIDLRPNLCPRNP